MSGGSGDVDYLRAQRMSRATGEANPALDAYAQYREQVQPGGWAVRPNTLVASNDGASQWSLGQWDPNMGGAMPYSAFSALYKAMGGAKPAAPAPVAPAPGPAAPRPATPDPSTFLPALPPPTMRATQRLSPGVQGLLDPAQLYLPQGRR